MDIFCENCQKKVGKIADEKIPSGKKLSVSCPKCGEKIYFEKSAKEALEYDFSPEAVRAALAAEEGQDSSRSTAVNYDFSIMEIIREAWDLTSGAKGPIWGAIAVAMLVIIVFSILVAFIAAAIGGGPLAAGLGGAAQLTISIAGYPFMAGLILLAIRRSVDLPINYKLAFSCYRAILPIVIASVLTSIFTTMGFFLLLIPGIYLCVAYVLTMHLIVDREEGPWQAMEASRRAIQQHWFKVLGLYLLMGFITAISAIPFGIGLIWTIPMLLIVGGILYREIFGVIQEI